VHWFVACYVLLLAEIVRGLWSVTLEWIKFGCVHKLYPKESDCVPAVRRLKLVTETGLIVRQYDRLSQQHLAVYVRRWNKQVRLTDRLLSLSLGVVVVSKNSISLWLCHSAMHSHSVFSCCMNKAKFHYNDLLRTCWRHLDMSTYFAVSLTRPQQVGHFPVYGEYGETRLMDFGQYVHLYNPQSCYSCRS